MNIIYVGAGDSFAAELVNKLVKEDHTVHLIAKTDFPAGLKPALNYTFYSFDASMLKMEKVFASVEPDVVVFGGELFGTAAWEHGERSNQYYLSLVNTLNFVVKYNCGKLVYLSSTEVYGDAMAVVDEGHNCNPSSYKGILCRQGEELVEALCKDTSCEQVILRMAPTYGYQMFEGKNDLVSEAYQELIQLREIQLEPPRWLQPLSIKDGAEAIFRALGHTPCKKYNVAAEQGIGEEDFYAQLKKVTQGTAEVQATDVTAPGRMDCTLIKNELEWFSYHSIGEYLKDYHVEIAAEEKKVRKRNFAEIAGSANREAVRTAENLILFCIFAGLSLLFQDHSVLRNVEFMYIAIVISALIFGVKQSILTVICSFLLYLYTMGVHTGNFFTIFLNAETFLQLAQFIFMGVVVGYAVERGKVKMEQMEIERTYLENEYNELKDIHKDNVLIKKQYEKRLLGYKTSLPKLYSITNQLDSLNPEVIFSSIVNIFQNVMETKTVAVYSYTSKSGFARLVASANDESVFHGKSFRLADHEALKNKLAAGEIYIGDQWSGDNPALAGAVFHKGEIIALFILKEMSFSHLNLYQVNLFRTLISLITASFVKAYKYEERVHEDRYVGDTEILKAKEFMELLDIKEKNRQSGIAAYTLIRLPYEGNLTTFFFENSNAFRGTDFFGMDNQDTLYVLLAGTGETDMHFVDARLKKREIQYQVVNYDQVSR